MQTVDQLNLEFGMERFLLFDEPYRGMYRALIDTPSCSAELYLQGAQLTQWRPSGEEEVLYLSSQSQYFPGKAIRGGIPVIFPWFGAPETSPVHPPEGSPSHGFARISPWTVRFAALSGEDIHISLTLDPKDRIHADGFDSLQPVMHFIIGKILTIRLSVANTALGGTPPTLFEEALHTYFRVGDVDQVVLNGLVQTNYLDKTDHFVEKLQTESELRISGEIDRPYLNTSQPIILRDDHLQRRLILTKEHSRTTVIWNPAAQLAANLSDLDDWHSFVCVEPANVSSDAIKLEAGTTHTMSMQLAVQPLHR